MSLHTPAPPRIRDFRVVTHRNWLAEQFAPFGGVQDFGFDIDPAKALDTMWWASGQWVGRAAASGVRLRLLSCGTHWLERLPREWTGRRIRTGTREELLDQVRQWGLRYNIHVKLPEIKTDDFPAKVISVDDLDEVLSSQGFGVTTLYQISTEVNFRSEARFFVADNVVTAHSWYRFGNSTQDSPGFQAVLTNPAWQDLVISDMNSMLSLANEVATHADAPRGYVLDVGVTSGFSPVPLVIEANAAWSSNPYDADMTGVMSAVRASQDFENDHTIWGFDPTSGGGLRYTPLRTSSRTQ